MIKHILKPVLFILLLLNLYPCSAQYFNANHYPQNYFAYPAEATVSLSANFGELRPNHYHMGLDCRTDKIQNKKVRKTKGSNQKHLFTHCNASSNIIVSVFIKMQSFSFFIKGQITLQRFYDFQK